ncbi:MAG TPA: molybdenum cofactor biosynthesis protein MoaE [Microterricola sp.]
MNAPLIAISPSPLDLAAHLAAVDSAAFGAVATFIGQVRDHDPDVDGAVVALDYSAHPDAPRLLTEIVDRVARTSADNGHEVRISASHRVGHLVVGDLALIVCVASAHRAATFDVCRELVETIKAELPVWKRQSRADGVHNWVGLPEA